MLAKICGPVLSVSICVNESRNESKWIEIENWNWNWKCWEQLANCLIQLTLNAFSGVSLNRGRGRERRCWSRVCRLYLGNVRNDAVALGCRVDSIRRDLIWFFLLLLRFDLLSVSLAHWVLRILVSHYRSERSIVRVSIYQSSQPQQICPPVDYSDNLDNTFSSYNCNLDYTTMSTATATIQPPIGLGPAYDRQQRWVYYTYTHTYVYTLFCNTNWRIAFHSTDSGWDNPFRPGGDLSREADEIVSMIRGKAWLTLQYIIISLSYAALLFSLRWQTHHAHRGSYNRQWQRTARRR